MLVAIVLGLFTVALFTVNKQLDKKYKEAVLNLKASQVELSDSKDQVAAYKLSLSQMEYFGDSIFKEMDAIRKELKIKDKNLNSIQYITSTVTKTDTISFTDTLFVNPSLSLDTLLSDKWYSLGVHLSFPATIAVSPCFKSEKYIVVSQRKETVNPPKKFFLFRLFQKKHRVLQVDVVEKNPYIENGTGKYVEIMK